MASGEFRGEARGDSAAGGGEVLARAGAAAATAPAGGLPGPEDSPPLACQGRLPRGPEEASASQPCADVRRGARGAADGHHAAPAGERVPIGA
jgi:hypothetical protein